MIQFRNLIESQYIYYIIRKTCIGKSELINALKGEDVAKTGGFRPVTKEIKHYKANSLRIFDNQGYEISKNSNLDITLDRIKTLIIIYFNLRYLLFENFFI